MNFLTHQNHLIVYMRFICIFSLKYNSSRGTVRESRKYSIYSICMAFFGQILYWSVTGWYLEALSVINTRGQVTFMIHIIEVLVLETVILIIVTNAFFQKTKLVKLLNELLKTEREVSEIQTISNYESLRRISSGYLSGVIVFYIMLFILKYFFAYAHHHHLLIISIFYMTCTTSLCVVVIFLIIIVKTQLNMFKVFNQIIKKSLYQIQHIEKLKKVLILHNKTCNTIRLMNEAVGMYNVAVFIYILGVHTCKLFIGTLVIVLDGYNQNVLLYDGQLNTLWTYPILVLFLSLSYECGKTTQEAEKVRYSFEAVFRSFPDLKVNVNVNILHNIY